MSYIIGWVLIGLAAALGAWIWPFRRGLVGLLVNAGLGGCGAVCGGMLGVSLGLLGSPRDPFGLALAALGALVLLLLGHLVWSAAHPARRHGHA
ncbi:MAG TPA: hypothetical protein VGL81_34700 [Polyangiaceae bacterium]|jgi:uncharacterized membrane protein YeaQ/YmgE (transglycosylase-associated protein family)